MSNSYIKLSVVVLLGTLSLGLSSVAKADLFVQWLLADKRMEKMDCISTCSQNPVIKFPIPTGIDRNTGKPSFFICVTHKESRRSSEWRAGFNKTGENSCVSAFDNDEVYHGTEYYCQCTNNTRPKIFR
jgi:hypothetical protein